MGTSVKVYPPERHSFRSEEGCQKRDTCGAVCSADRGRFCGWQTDYEVTFGELQASILVEGPRPGADQGWPKGRPGARRVGGRLRSLGEEDIPQVQALMKDEGVSTADICERFGI